MRERLPTSHQFKTLIGLNSPVNSIPADFPDFGIESNPMCELNLGTVRAFVLLLFATGCSTRPPEPTTAVVPEVPPGPPMFEDVTKLARIDFTYRNGEEAGHFAIIESLGGGVALFDYDNDGNIDVFISGGGKYDGKKVLGLPGRLYHNLGSFLGTFHFSDVTAALGLDQAGPYSHGAAAFDYDCDGDLDLLITGYNRVVLYRNEAGKRFVDVTKAAGLHDSLWSSTAAWGDLDGDGYPEIYIAHYGDWGFDTNHPIDCSYDGKTRDVCQPRRFKPLPHSLYRNNRDGTFTDISSELKVKKNGRGMGVLIADFNNDARPDIYVANDTDDNFLFMNRSKGGKLALEEVGLLSGVARDERGEANGSMGVDAADFDRSGRASIIVTNYEGELPALYANLPGGDPRFAFISQPSGVAAIGGTFVGWGASFQDLDHDGWEDLVMVNGHAIRFPTKIDRRQKPVLLRNEKGFFTNVSRSGGSYFDEPHNARGIAFGDLDKDGRVDCVVSHLNEPVAMLKNIAPVEGKHWIGLEPIGANHRDIAGARIVIEGPAGKQTRFVKGGGSFGCTHDRRFIVGLGSHTSVTKVTVHWPSGSVQEFTGLPIDRYSRLVQKP